MPSWPLDPQRFAPRAHSDGQLVIFLNGILTAPGNQFAWTDRAERWFGRFTPHDFDSHEYFHTVLFSRLCGERLHTGRAAELLIQYFRAWAELDRVPRLHLVAHSRGCELARRLIVERRIRVESLHLFAAAADADCERNGLAPALRDGRLQRLRLYTSRGDAVLRWIAGSSCGLYGRLGFTGPRRLPIIEPRVRVIERETFGHSTWFAPTHFAETMQMLAADLDELP